MAEGKGATAEPSVGKSSDNVRPLANEKPQGTARPSVGHSQNAEAAENVQNQANTKNSKGKLPQTGEGQTDTKAGWLASLLGGLIAMLSLGKKRKDDKDDKK
ncbi:LPXTG cell wall anchor domain-containing protein [Lactobacillus crispatus]|nr:LPXTG cell wall anchor domain-containing protein [Lactobacillus crispatus]